VSKRTQENVVAGLVLLLFVGLLVVSFSYGPRARLVPVPVAIVGILLTLVQIYWQNSRPAEELSFDLLEVLVAGQDKVPEAMKSDSRPRTVANQLQGLGIVGALLALFLALGPFPAMFIFMTAYLSLSGYSRLLRSLLIATALTLGLWVLFVMILRVQVYWGLLEPIALSLGL